MTPYYDHAGITIYHADAADVHSHLQGEVIVTDPPFGISGGVGSNRKRGKGTYASTGWEDTLDYITDSIVPTLTVLVNRIGRAVIKTGKPALPAYCRSMNPTDIGCFWQPAAPGFGSWGHNNFTPILYFGRSPNGNLGNSGIQVTEVPPPIAHPCPTPYKAWAWLVCKASLEGETVIDPFMGSGTTLLAAKNNGRKAIGVEIEERYCELAAERLSQDVLDLSSDLC